MGKSCQSLNVSNLSSTTATKKINKQREEDEEDQKDEATKRVDEEDKNEQNLKKSPSNDRQKKISISAANNKMLSKDHHHQLEKNSKSAGLHDSLVAPIKRSRLTTLAQIGEDWLYLALLGIIMALLSFSMDSIISLLLNTRLWLSEELGQHGLLLEYSAWCLVPILLVTFSTGFVHLCSPTAIGSGIPEMKTILRGVVLNEYLTFRTLIAKIVGLTFTLGSGLPLGKEGPFVHMASIVATLLSKLVASFQGIYENESRTSEMLSAACAVGVAATFYAPIGGVLFSIEVTTVYFAVRNYWRGFFAACCGATVWRLLGFYVKNDESISALFKTNFSTDYPFDPLELLVFSFIGATCGLAGAAYIKFHRVIVQFFRRHKQISGFFQKNRFVYPILITLIITTSTFPPLLGKFTASTLSTHTSIEHLFSNRTWGLGNQDLISKEILDHWTTPTTGFYLHLILYIMMLFWTSALASTIPIPSGIFIPVLKMGAAYGRLVGELMAAAYPNGIKYGRYSSHPSSIVPGSYAVVGAAALSGAVTHTISTSVILFEMTGQIVHIIPVILGVLISNAVCQSLQPSIYDSIIEIKKLPYLPPIASSNSIVHKIIVREFMNKKLPFVWKEKCTYADVKSLLSEHKKIISFPLVESPKSMKLLGSIARPDLLRLLYLHLGRERRLQEVCRRNSDTLSPALNLLSTISGRFAQEQSVFDAERRLETDLAAAAASVELKEVAPTNEATLDKDRKLSTMSNQDCIVDCGGLEFKLKRSASDINQRCETGSTTSGEQAASGSSSSSVIELKAAMTDAKEMIMFSQNNPAAETDSTRLIAAVRATCKNKQTPSMEQQQQSSRRRNYGSTTRNGDLEQQQQAVDSPATETQPADAKNLGLEENLLAECQKESNSDSDEEESGDRRQKEKSVAKMINHYNRGSSMDDDQLDLSIQEVEDQLAQSASKQQQAAAADIVVVVYNSVENTVEVSNNALAAQQQDRSATTRLIKCDSNESPSSQQQRQKRVLSRQRTPNRNNNNSSSYNYNSTNSILSGASPSLSLRPTKSILKTSATSASLLSKQRNNFSISSFSSQFNGGNGGGTTTSATGIDLQQQQWKPTRGRGELVSISRDLVTSANQNSNNDRMTRFHDQDGTELNNNQPSSNNSQQNQLRHRNRKVRLPRLRVVDMTPEEQAQWEKEQLNTFIDISQCQIDEAPFQLVEQTSLYRVHTLFSMLGLNHAYVTSFGRLVGIVALKDIRNALEMILQDPSKYTK